MSPTSQDGPTCTNSCTASIDISSYAASKVEQVALQLTQDKLKSESSFHAQSQSLAVGWLFDRAATSESASSRSSTQQTMQQRGSLGEFFLRGAQLTNNINPMYTIPRDNYFMASPQPPQRQATRAASSEHEATEATQPFS